MALLWLVDTTIMDNVTFRVWMKASHTQTCLQVVCIQCFSEVMALLWLVEAITMDNATFRFWMKASHTPRFPQVVPIQCFSEVMALLWLLEAISLENVTFRVWMKASHTQTCLQVVCIQCFSEVMALMWLVEAITMDNVTFLRWNRGVTSLLLHRPAVATSAITDHVSIIPSVFCSWILWSWCVHADMLKSCGAWGADLCSKGLWPCFGYSQRNCPEVGCHGPQCSSGLARWTVVGFSTPNNTVDHTFGSEWNMEASAWAHNIVPARSRSKSYLHTWNFGRSKGRASWHKILY